MTPWSPVIELRDVDGLPDPAIDPPNVAHSGDPFAALRIVHLLARIPRGQSVRVRDVVDRLNADYLGWSFTRAVVLDAIVQLQANWQADYRTRAGIDLADGQAGEEITIEDSSRVDPWIVRQCERLAGECRARLAAFARDEGATP
jgi:hypothetical protein